MRGVESLFSQADCTDPPMSSMGVRCVKDAGDGQYRHLAGMASLLNTASDMLFPDHTISRKHTLILLLKFYSRSTLNRILLSFR